MQRELEVTLRPIEGALMRLLSMVERRGFPIHSAQAAMREDSSSMEVRLSIQDPARSMDNLCKQLAKLVDVTAVKLLDSQETGR
ncbi:MAG: ACT domain-containing protein [Planctomycetota bacterium]